MFTGLITHIGTVSKIVISDKVMEYWYGMIPIPKT